MYFAGPRHNACPEPQVATDIIRSAVHELERDQLERLSIGTALIGTTVHAPQRYHGLAPRVDEVAGYRNLN